MREVGERMELTALSPEQIAPLERAMPPDWPETWKELSTSHYLTLLSMTGAVPADCARLAMLLTQGIAQDLGGRQPYIPVGAGVIAGARARRVIELLEARRSYKDVASITGLTESRVRQIEGAWRREQIELRQGTLQLD